LLSYYCYINGERYKDMFKAEFKDKKELFEDFNYLLHSKAACDDIEYDEVRVIQDTSKWKLTIEIRYLNDIVIVIILEKLLS